MHSILFIALIAAAVFADTFIHGCIRGSNNKLNEQRGDSNRQSNNRVFDSQNGNGGGYYTNPPDGDELEAFRLYYYHGSQLTLEWVNQHGSGDNSYIKSNFVWQYMCNTMGGEDETPWLNENLRDGTTTDQIQYQEGGEPDTVTNGRHEPWGFYHECRNRERNQGLFTADRNLQGDTARFTRQNNNGAASGYECPEERDYYPYWHPTPFVDIAYLTSSPEAEDRTGCEWVQENSFNVKGYHSCTEIEQNNENSCQAAGGEWKEYGPWNKFYDYIEAPECLESEWSRENHLGFGRNGRMQQYNWTIPAVEDDSICVLRLRYNMSTFEIPYDLDSKFNDDNSPVQGRVNNNNDIVENFSEDYPGIDLYIALNTNQFGRVFEDRTHTFKIKQRPDGLNPRAVILNFGNKGGRGNLQNIYPMVENDFCPQYLEVKVGEYVHFQFVGSNFGQNFNRNNAAGGGLRGGTRANRVNLVQMENPHGSFPMLLKDQTFFEEKDTATLAAMIGQDATKCENDATGEDDATNCGKLNYSYNGYVDLGLVRMNNTGESYFLSTRNNINTNRAQKATIVTLPAVSWVAVLLMTLAGVLAAGGAAVGIAAHQAKADPSGRAAQLWDRMSSLGSGSSLGGGY